MEYDGTERLLYSLAVLCTIWFILAVVSKSPKKGAFREWGEAGFTAVWLALAIRILLVEAYSIPSESMVPTLLIKDHLVVSKLSFGWHVPFTKGRVLAFSHPKRGQIVIFVPPHLPKLSFVKRCVGVPGDTIEVRAKQVFVYGQNAENPFSYGHIAQPPAEVIPPVQQAYSAFHAAITESQSRDPEFHEWLGPFQAATGRYYLDARYRPVGPLLGRLLDQPAAGKLELYPKDFKAPKPVPGTGQVDWTADQGLGNRDFFGPYTLKDGEYWMMGDNRDNSADSRYFGPVRWEAIRGTPLFRYWPPSRMGLVR
jgi:signal peptidase I